MKWVLGLLVVVALAILLIWTKLGADSLPSMTLRWTSPGDDGNVGTATQYELRWSTTLPDTSSRSAIFAWWNAANNVPNMPAPLLAGTNQTTIVAPTGGFPEGAYYWLIRTQDEAGNWSTDTDNPASAVNTPNWGFSNVAWRIVTDNTPPAPITDLEHETAL